MEEKKSLLKDAANKVVDAFASVGKVFLDEFIENTVEKSKEDTEEEKDAE